MGTDLLLMGAYRFKKYIALDFGGAFAKLKNIVSGYCNGIVAPPRSIKKDLTQQECAFHPLAARVLNLDCANRIMGKQMHHSVSRRDFLKLSAGVVEATPHDMGRATLSNPLI